MRHGATVERERFDDLDAAIAALRRRVEEVRAAGPLEPVKAFREYEPAQRVAARVELSTGGWLRGRDAGIDVMGDGALVAYAGGVRRRPLEPGAGGDAVDAVREAMR